MYKVIIVVIICATGLTALRMLNIGLSAPPSQSIVARPVADVDTGAAIRNLIEKDKALGAGMSAASDQIKTQSATRADDRLDLYSAAIDSYVAKARALRSDVCPRDFSEAFHRHLSSWADEGDAISSHPHIRSDDEALLEGFFRGLGGDITGGVIRIEDEKAEWLTRVKRSESNVHKSWAEVEALAVRYGAQ